MKKTSNELHDLWISAGDTVENLNEQINIALVDNSVTPAKLEELKNERDAAKIRRDMFKDQYAEARAAEVVAMENSEKEPLNKEEQDIKTAFVNNFKALVKGENFTNASSPATSGLVSSGEDDNTAGNGGLTIPKDIQTAIRLLTRQYLSLQDYVNVENTTVQQGSRNIETWETVTPLVKLDDEDTNIDDMEASKLHLIKYLIAEYAGILTVTNSLLADSAENILAWLTTNISRKVVATRNAAIIAAWGKAPAKATLTKFDDIKATFYSLDPALRGGAAWFTNTSGMLALSTVKDAMGNYLLQRDPTQPERYLLEGKPVVELSDTQLPDAASSTHPLYFGDGKAYATLFDRESMSLATSTEAGNAFYRNQTKLRVIDRFDLQVVDDKAMVSASFKVIADQKANIGAGA